MAPSRPVMDVQDLLVRKGPDTRIPGPCREFPQQNSFVFKIFSLAACPKGFCLQEFRCRYT